MEQTESMSADRNVIPRAAPPEGASPAFLDGASEALGVRYSTVRGFAQLLDRHLRDGAALDQTQRLSGNLNAEINQLGEVLERFFIASTLHWGTWRISPRPIDLGQALGDALARVEATQHASRSPISVAQVDNVIGSWDRQWLVEALLNVIDNAVKYSPEGSVVQIEVRRAGDAAVVAVRDRGIGVPPDEREAIFQPFVRGRLARQLAPGAGLGLFIATNAVRIHRGTISVDTAPDGGSVFVLHLPLQAGSVRSLADHPPKSA